MFFKTDAERAAAQAGRARHDAAEAGASAASGARNLGAAVLATLAEVTAPKDDKSGKRHAQKARAKAIKAARKDRASAAKAAGRAKEAAGKATTHGKSAVEKKSAKAGGSAAALAGIAGAKASEGAKAARTQGAHAAEVLREQGEHAGEVLRDRSSAALSKARDSDALGTAAEKAGAGAALVAALAAVARDKAATTRDRAVLGVDHGIDAAVPRAQDGVAGVAPVVDHVRDLINDELLPKIQDMLGEVQSGKDRLLAKDEGVVAAVTGAPKAGRHRKGGAMIALGLLAAAGAGVAWWLSQQQKQPAADPWASRPGTSTDPWAASTPAPATAVAVTDAPVTDEPLAAPAADPVVGAPLADPVADAPLADPVADAPVAGRATTEMPRMLESEEIDELGKDTPDEGTAPRS